MQDIQSQPRGAFRYLTFGCRQAWIEVFLTKWGQFPDGLGPRQRVALHYYLRDAGLLQRDWGDGLSTIGQLLRPALESHSTAVWEVIWTNWTMSSALFSWWATLPSGEYTRDQCLVALAARLSTSTDRSVRDALCALVATLRQTPIGWALGQGLVASSGRSWRILKTEPGLPVSWWALYSIATLFPTGIIVSQNNNSARGRVAQVLGVSNQVLASALEALWQPDLFTIHQEGEGQLQVRLVPGVTPEIILRRWIQEDN